MLLLLLWVRDKHGEASVRVYQHSQGQGSGSLWYTQLRLIQNETRKIENRTLKIVAAFVAVVVTLINSCRWRTAIAWLPGPLAAT